MFVCNTMRLLSPPLSLTLSYIRQRKHTALYFASVNSRVDMVEFLCRNGAKATDAEVRITWLMMCVMYAILVCL